MSKGKMSSSDKINRLYKKLSTALDDEELSIKEALKIRNKTLRELLYVEYEMMIKRECPPYDIETCMLLLGCNERTAYDFQRTMIFLHLIHSRYQEYLHRMEYELASKKLKESKKPILKSKPTE